MPDRVISDAGGLRDYIVRQAHNNAWASLRFLKACEALSEAEFSATRTSFFPSIRATLNHILWVDQYYVDAVDGKDALRRYSEPDPDFPTATLLKPVQTAVDRRLVDFCERQTNESLAREIVLPRPNRAPPPCSIATILAHLFEHQIHHRGQAHAMLAGTRVKPPQLDEFYLSGELELRRDELRELGLPEV